MCCDVVRVGEDALAVPVVVLHGDLELRALDAAARILCSEVHRRLMQHLLVAVQILHERDDAALIAEALANGLLLGTVVRDGNAHARIQKRLLAETVRQHGEIELDGIEDLLVRQEGDGGSRLLAIAHVALDNDVARFRAS